MKTCRKPKRRTKKYAGPKYVAKNPMKTFLGGMSDTHVDHLQDLLAKNHIAMVNITAGRGDKDDFDRVVGVINMATVMSEQGIGPEFRETMIAAQTAMCELGKRGWLSGRFVFTGDELRIVNEAMACHDAQCTNVRSMDIDRASNEVIRRLTNRINTTSVRREVERLAQPAYPEAAPGACGTLKDDHERPRNRASNPSQGPDGAAR